MLLHLSAFLHKTAGKYFNKFLSWFRKEEKCYKDIVSSLQNPEEIHKFMKKTFKYEADWWGGILDNTMKPAEMLYYKKGDCDDFAYFAYDCLDRLGYDCVMVSMQFPSFKHWHVSCFFKDENGAWCSLGNWGLQKNKTSFNDLFCRYEESNEQKVTGYFTFDDEWKTLETKKIIIKKEKANGN